MMSDPTFAIVIISVCGAAAVTVRTIADATVRHAQATRGNASDKETLSDARLARLEVAVESIAVEVERISEGQRFTTRLLNDQAQRSMQRLDRPGKTDTPH
jgi:hypothetical protein